VDAGVPIEIATLPRYVSRGGDKLAAALDAFAIAPEGLVCLDVGASTGGFTDVLLERGATRVYALDVGRAQLAERLLRDPRVVSMERTNARGLRTDSLPEPAELATIDVSFVSLRLVLGPVATTFGSKGGRVVALVKPQFEAPKGAVDRDGVVRDRTARRAALVRIADAARVSGYRVLDACGSPLLGPAGNRECFLELAFGPAPGAEPNDLDARFERAVGPG
jgi:23S rRNA (cytidine1920-2'-O)/16S rRNA (cytidine1409-2'-O)-methyltransferase